MNILEKLILALIDASSVLGLNENDLISSKELFFNKEYGLAFDTIITQLYEYEIEIDVEFYDLIESIAKKMNISEEEYSYMKELIRDEKVVPKSVKDKLSEILIGFLGDK